MKWLTAVITMLCFLVHQTYAVQQKARSVFLGDGDIGEIKTALGYSTILQFDSRPTSIVLGDQDAFKVEYVGESLTVKPLIPGVKSNMFVFTDYDRFNFRISATSSDQADYLVKVSKTRAKSYPVQVANDPKTPPTRELRVAKTVSCDPLALTIEKMAVPASGNYLVITFKLRHGKMGMGKELGFSPGDIELIQSKKLVPIENLYLDGLAFSRSKSTVRGTMVVKKSDLRSGMLALLGFSASFLSSPKCLRASFSPMN